MYVNNFPHVVTFLLLGLVSSNGYYLHTLTYCLFKGHDLEEVEYNIVHYFNKEIMMTWNSTQGKWTGHRANLLVVAGRWSDDPAEKTLKSMEKYLLCDKNIPGLKTCLGVLAAKPKIELRSVSVQRGRHPSMLVCSAYNFFPKQILVTWLRDGKEITSDVSSSQLMTDGNFYYQFHSFLEYTPTSGETITCMVEHPSLTEPMFQDWDSSLPESERNEIIVGSIGLLLGLISVSFGLIHYKRKSAARTILCHDRVLVPIEDLPTVRMDESEEPAL